jgi:polyisoprenoid-binding protein YceI
MFKRMMMTAAVMFLASSVVRAEQWQIDGAHSSVNFQVTHLVISKVNGKFSEFSGTFNFDGKDVTTGSVEMTVKAASITTDNDRRDSHLKSPDFFDVAKYPDITFKSKRVVKGEGQKFQLVGDLTMHGVTKEVTFACEFYGTADLGGQVNAGFGASVRINRQDYGVSWSQTLDSGGLVASNDVDITINLELNRVA